jgi:hypothetical protein
MRQKHQVVQQKHQLVQHAYHMMYYALAYDIMLHKNCTMIFVHYQILYKIGRSVISSYLNVVCNCITVNLGVQTDWRSIFSPTCLWPSTNYGAVPVGRSRGTSKDLRRSISSLIDSMVLVSAHIHAAGSAHSGQAPRLLFKVFENKICLLKHVGGQK